MHRNRTWQIDPEELRTQRNRILPIEGGDGSTLSLDFTTGVLDPRLTFTRSTNATFINSQGYVQYADANLLQQSESFSGAPWGAAGTIQIASATTTNPIGGNTAISATMTATTSSAGINAITSSSIGIPYVFRVWVKGNTTNKISIGLLSSGSWLTNVTITAVNGFTGVTISGSTYRNVTNLSTTEWTQLEMKYTAATTNADYIYLYPATVSPQTIGDSLYLWGAQLNSGSTANPYYKTTSTAYQAPRFDYDPTTLTPRGLLIEGSATNLALRSGDFNTTVTDGTNWIASGYTAGTLSTTLPDGTTGDARRISFASGSGSFRSSTITVTASTAYTFSFWARNNGGSQARFRVWNATAGSSIVDYTQSVNNYVSQIGGANNTSSTWVRVSVQFTTPAGCTAIYVYPCSSDSGTVDLLIWGAQVELGSGASSYIPTGASTGNRAEDSCVMTGTNFSSWFAGATEGVLYTQFEKPRSQSGNVLHDFAAVGSRYNTGEGLILYVSNSTLLPTAILWATGGAVFGGGIATAIPSVTKHALKWFAVNDVTNYSNGVVGSTGNGTGTVTPAMLSIGANSASGTAATRDWLNACVRTVKFWPVALPDSQIIALTT